MGEDTNVLFPCDPHCTADNSVYLFLLYISAIYGNFMNSYEAWCPQVSPLKTNDVTYAVYLITHTYLYLR